MLNSCKKTVVILMTILFFVGCKTSKDSYYSYSVNAFTYTKTRGTLPTTISNVISYGEYVFEFKNLIREIYSKIGDSPSEGTFTADTIGVFLLDGKKKQYYEFDSFAVNGNLIEQGPLNSKTYGSRFSTENEKDTSDTFFGPLKEATVNNIQCFYSTIFSKDGKNSDSIDQTVILIKNEHLNSLYKINGAEFTDKEYCIVGYRTHSLVNKDAFFQELSSLRPLTNKEKRICKHLIRKSKQ